MSDEQKRLSPFQYLGSRLKQLRQKHQESVAEVSGAVEIDMTTLSSFETGETRPPEDILLLLISHFDMQDQEASKLWKLAGYDQQKLNQGSNIEDGHMTQSIIVLPVESRVAYTDMVNITTNEFGVVVNFMQADGIGDRPLLVSRLGMSKEHAQKVLESLQTALKVAEPKVLPLPKATKSTPKKSKQIDSK